MSNLIDFKSEQEYNAYMSNVDNKLKIGEKLTLEEIDNFCFALPYNEKKKYSFCDNDRFIFLYLHKLDDGKTRPRLSDDQINDLNDFITEWKQFLDSNKFRGREEKYIIEEYKAEYKNLVKDYKGKPKTEELKKEFDLKLSEIIAYNKYMFLKGIGIFPTYSFPIELNIDNKKILIDEYILFHSLLRHYGSIVKQTNLKKSYFTEDVLVENIYELIINFLKKLEEKKVSIENIISIRFLYKSEYYQLFTKKFSENGKIIGYRINSFSPIENPTHLKDINENYHSVIVEQDFALLARN